MFDSLYLVSYLAPNLFEFYTAIGRYLGRVFDLEVQIVQSACDSLDDLKLRRDEWDLLFICGLPFWRFSQKFPGQLTALVAPVMQAERYGDRPIYFSDVIVNAASPVTTFEQLAGKTFCYNDLGSNSGYNLFRYRWMQTGEQRFFDRVMPSGSHQQSMQWVADGRADCAAIDSTVLEQERRDHPERSRQLRVIESLGPAPMPPIVASQHLGSKLLDAFQDALLQPDLELQSRMNKVQVRRFARVHLTDYEAIARLHEHAIQADLATIA